MGTEVRPSGDGGWRRLGVGTTAAAALIKRKGREDRKHIWLRGLCGLRVSYATRTVLPAEWEPAAPLVHLANGRNPAVQTEIAKVVHVPIDPRAVALVVADLPHAAALHPNAAGARDISSRTSSRRTLTRRGNSAG